tara:strand:+ start:9198 stop:10727 length:1530 start_codon:yes stop_codon:yes gene_type:complete
MKIDLINKIKKTIGFSCKKNERDDFALLIGRSRIFNSIYLVFCALALNKKKGINQFFLNEKSLISSEKNLFINFGIRPKNYSDNVKFLNICVILIKSVFLLAKGLFLIFSKDLDYFVKNFKVADIYIGDLIFDSYVRHKHRFLNPKFDLYFGYYLLLGVYKTLLFNDFFDKKKLKYLVVASHTYANTTGVSVRVALKKNIKVIISTHSEFLNFTTQKLDKGKYYINTKDNLKKLKQIDYSNKKFNKFFKKRKKINSGFSFTGKKDILNAYGSKRIISRRELIKKIKINKNNFQRIIVIAPHAFSDAPHSNGRLFLFTDYFAQLKETLNYVQKFKKILWIVRPHPTGKDYGEQGIVENLVSKIKSSNIKMCPKNINTDNLINITDGVITGRGKIALEYTSSGKPAMIAGKCSFSDLGFLIEPKNKRQYFSSLKKFSKMKKLNAKKISRARNTIVYLEKYQDSFVKNNLIPPFKNKNIKFVLKGIENNLKYNKNFLSSKYFLDISNKINSL